MLRHVPLVLMVLFLPVEAHARAPHPDAHLEILQETRWVRSAEALHEACGRTDPIRACTQLTADLLPGPCVAESESWRMTSLRARLIVVRVLIGPSREPFNELTVQHEANHIAHFREGLSGYLDELMEPMSRSESECTERREEAIRALADRMRQIERASNRRLHAQRPVGRSAENRP